MLITNEIRNRIDILAQSTTFISISEKWLELKKMEISMHNYETYKGYLKHFM